MIREAQVLTRLVKQKTWKGVALKTVPCLLYLFANLHLRLKSINIHLRHFILTIMVLLLESEALDALIKTSDYLACFEVENPNH